MLSIKSISSATEAAAYYENLAAEDYYETGGEPLGNWRGGLRDNLYLSGQIRDGELGLMLKGFHPTTGEALASNAGSEHKAGWDCTFSSPKSVSVAWALGDEDTRRAVQTAHAKAVESGLRFIEEHALSNRDRGIGHERIHKVLAATYEHCTSREQDPQLHTHVLIANLGVRTDGTMCALDFDTRWKMAAGAVYRAELASQLQLHGFGIEPDTGKSFRLQDIDPELCLSFSKRREEILEQAKELGVISAKGMQIATFVTRAAKSEPLPRASLLEGWRDEAARLGFGMEHIEQAQQYKSNLDPMPTVDQILDGMTLQMSTFTSMQLHQAVAVQAQGHLNAVQIQQQIDELLINPEVVPIRAFNPKLDRGWEITEIRYTTQTQLALENKLLDQAKQRSIETDNIVNPTAVMARYDTLTEEQNHAIKHITQEAGAVKVVEGMAGTGKGFILGVAHKVWQESGLEVHGAALAGKAADGLKQSTGIPSQTLHSLIEQLDQNKKHLNTNSVLVIDEASMVGTRQLATIMNHVHNSGAKLVLVGDSKQLQPIDAGGALRLLSQELGHASLKDIQRQKHLEDKLIVEQVANGQGAKALQSLRERGRLHVEATNKETIHHMVNDWWGASDGKPTEQNLMLAGTRADLFEINQTGRKKMRDAQLLGRDFKVEVLHNEVRVNREFAAGDRIAFGRNNYQLGLRNGETGTLKRIDIHHAGYLQFTIERDAINTKLQDKTVTIALTSDERVGNRYEAIDHAYAISVHKAQGATVDKAFVLASDSMLDREWAYVAVSRSRFQTQLYCSAALTSQLDNSIGLSRQKEMAISLVSELEHQI